MRYYLRGDNFYRRIALSFFLSINQYQNSHRAGALIDKTFHEFV